ncbi:MAG: patatin-like phospholipase family protein [Phycisphaerae bacterium]|jgi:hypothetical protein
MMSRPPGVPSRTSTAKSIALAAFGLFLAGCGGVVRHPLPAELAEEAQVAGMSGIRSWGGEFSPAFQTDLVESVRQARSINPQGVVDANGYVNVLAISGGGAEGAFGAGLLCGWTQAGNRPTFKLVTGISTGALIAPFAFVGPEYDFVLQKFFTSVSTADIYTPRPLISVLAGTDGLTDTAPLARLLDQVVDEKLLAAVAQAHRQGRRLYIGTTNLDAGRLVIWNMGAIAASGQPTALTLFRTVMRASASIPVAFPPTYISVQARGRTYDEMHVDGGTLTQVFFYGDLVDLAAAARQAGADRQTPARIYVIRNAQIKTDWQTVKPRLLPIASRAITGLLFSQGVGDLYRIYAITARDGIDFKLASIPDDYESKAKEAFDRAEMTRLFDTAFALARDGYPWRPLPPGMKERPDAATQPAATQP